MNKLSPFDREKIRELREQGVLANVDPHRLDLGRGVIIVPCADGDQMPDVFGKQLEFCQCHGDPRIHTLALNGGAIALPANSPLNHNHLRKDLVLLQDISDAMSLKDIHVIALYAHAPCGAAGMCGLDVLEVVELLIQGKERLKAQFSGIKVACFFHVDYGNGRKHTYFISVQEWRRWKDIHY